SARALKQGVLRGRRRDGGPMRIRTIIVQGTGNTTGIEVPSEVVEALGAGKRPPVAVTLNGYTYRSSSAARGCNFVIGLGAASRAEAGASGGDELTLDIELDTAPREVEVPQPFASALDAEPAARATFDKLSYSNKSWHVLQVEGAKTD